MKFLPIVDTSGHRVLGHECLAGSAESRNERSWNALAEQAPSSKGLYFVTPPDGPFLSPSSMPHSSMKERFVFQIGDQADTVIESAGRYGMKVALCTSATTPGYLERICNLKPEYVKLDPVLVRNVEQPSSASAIRKIVELGDRHGLKVIGTGVSKARILEDLWLLGVEIMQGDIFGAPAFQAVRMRIDLGQLAGAVE